MAILGAFSLLTVLIFIAAYVVTSFGYYKALKRLGYQNAWLAWIPIANLYALADVAANGEESINVIGTLEVPAMVYKLWWLAMLVFYFVPVIGWLLTIIFRIIFLGDVFMRLFARIDNVTRQEEQVLGYIAGFIPFVAVVKFIVAK
jgi:hypothetical protein